MLDCAPGPLLGGYPFPHSFSRPFDSQSRSSSRSLIRLARIVTVEESDNQNLSRSWRAFTVDHLLAQHQPTAVFRHFSDVCVCVESSRDGGAASYFHLHRFVLEQRSEYFKALFASPLKGGQRPSVPTVAGDDDGGGGSGDAATSVLTVTMQETRRQVFATAVSFIYSNTAPDLSDSAGGADDDDDDVRMEEAVSRALEVLDLAERLVLPGLKTLAGAVLRKVLHCRAGDEPYPASTVGGAFGKWWCQCCWRR